MPNVEEVLRTWNAKPMDPKYFHGHPEISLRSGDYKLRGHIGNDASSALHPRVKFDPTYTSSGVVLQAPRRTMFLDSAVLGFNVTGTFADCLQIQGGEDRWRELTPVRWYGALLGSLIDVAKHAGLHKAMVIPSFLVNGWEAENAERLERIYDLNARRHGFQFSDELKRYVLDLI